MKIFLSGGGTAGHVNPALAIACEIKKTIPEAEFYYVGTPGGIENTLVKDYPMYHINIRGLRRSLSLSNIKTAFLTVRSFGEAKKLIKREKPDLVIGTGGYVCWPICSAAASLHVPCFLHESNSVPGLVVRKLQKKVSGVFINFEQTRSQLSGESKVYHVGTPVREEFNIFNREHEREKLDVGFGKKYSKLILSFGGSLGATRLNEEIISMMNSLGRQHSDVLMIHASGKREFAIMSEKAKALGIDKLDNCRIYEYIGDIPSKMIASDIVICRSGALTLSELAYSSTPSVLIPSPNVTDDQQYKNASVFEKAGAAVVFRESELEKDTLSSCVDSLLSDTQKLNEMREKAASFAVRDCGERIWNIIKDSVMAENK